MPQRFLRPGLTTSLHWNSLDWFGQSFYVRLLTLVDDYGRYDADARLLKAHCFPLNDDVTVQTIVSSCEQLLAKSLALFYTDTDGKPYLQLSRWQERPRSASRFPDPSANNCSQLLSVDSKRLLPSPSPSPSPSPPPSGAGGPVELPHGFPKTKEDAVIHAEFVGCPKDFAAKTWDKACGRGGRDSRDVQIRSWRHHLSAEWSFEQSRANKEKSSTGSAPVWRQIENIREKIAKHPANRDSVFHNPECSQEEKDELKAMFRKLDSLECGNG